MDIPAGTKRRFGLDDERSLIVQCESNRLVWPGPDPRPVDDDTGYHDPVPLAVCRYPATFCCACPQQRPTSVNASLWIGSCASTKYWYYGAKE